MARTKGSVGIDTERAIRAAAVDLMVRHGFAAMTLRELADAVGIQAGSVYRYITSKDQLLTDIMIGHMEGLVEALNAHLDVSADPLIRLDRFIDFHIRFHIAKQKEVFLAYMELRSLTSDARRSVVQMRRQYEHVLRDILQAGIAAGRFHCPDADVTAYAIISMLTGVCQWYSPKGRLSADAIVAIHKQLVINGVTDATNAGLPALAGVPADREPASVAAFKPRTRSNPSAD